MKKLTCPKCHGLGRIDDPRELAKTLRERRQKAKVSLRHVAQLMGISAAYLSDLERGNRHWDAELLTSFRAALTENK